MNKVYKVIWNSRLSCWQAVSELAKGHGSRIQTSGVASPATATLSHMLSAALLFGMAMLPLSVQAAIQNNALPTGAQVNSGSASFTQTNDTLNINQNSQTLSSNWNTFNIGQDATVNFNQPDQSSVAINHVLDSNASQIMGRLNANGQVFLLNPNGVVFSKTAQVNVGGIVASTLQLSDSDIQTGKYLLKGDASSNASIENHGSINTLSGGTVALIAPTVINTGSIKTPNGTTHLTAASQVTLALQDGSLTQYQVDEGVLQGLVDNGGAIVADNGAVYLSAKAKDSLSKAVVNHSGIIEANRLVQNAKGEIILLGDMQQGEVVVSGTLAAEGKNGQDGGFIETSAARVKIEQGTKVSTLSDTAQTGTWLIDPTDFTIAATGGDITGSDLSNNLTTNNITIQSTNGSTGDSGDINVNDNVTWSANRLTLNALNDININAEMTASSTAGLALEYGQAAVQSGNTATYYVNAPINLASTGSFSTKLGNDGAVKNYTIITSLGSAGSTTGTDLQGIDGNVSGDYVLGSDIDAAASAGWNSGEGFNPIGRTSNTSAISFSGTLDGLGHTVDNLTVNRPDTTYAGLIAKNYGDIRNIGMVGGSVKGAVYTGGLVGSNSGSITNAYATGDVSANSNISTYSTYAGGLVGVNTGSGNIENAYATGDVSASSSFSSSAGGLVGDNSGSIANAYATGDVSASSFSSSSAGGLAGSNSGSITNAYATGDVSTSSSSYSSYAGGLVGLNYGSITNAYATGDVSASSTSTSTYISYSPTAGGLVGVNYGSIENTYATGDVSASSTSNAYAYAGGLVGVNYGSIENTYATGDVSASSTSSFSSSSAGGLVGLNYGSITNAYATGDVSTSSSSAGGLAGSNSGSGNIENAYATGDVSTSSSSYSSYAGGLVGLNTSSITNAYATGDVSASSTSSSYSSYAGGLVGVNTGSGNIENAYATGDVSASSSSSSNAYAGGVVGFNYGSITDAYWNTETSGQANAVGLNNGTDTATGLTTEQMKKMSYFSGFDIDDQGGTGTVWRIYEGDTNPLLRSFLTEVDLSAVDTTTTYNGENQTLAQVAGVDSTKLLGGNTLNHRDAGTYSSNYYSNQQGYDLIGGSATLTIKKAAATVTANSDSTTYNGQSQSVTGFSATGLVNGETESVLAQVSASGSGTNAGNYVSTASGSDNNYDLTFVNGSLDIAKAKALVTANSGNTTYNGQSQSVDGFSATGLVNGETESVLTGVNAGASGTNAGNYVSTASGSDNNYVLTFVNGSLDIAKAKALVTANSDSTTYNGQQQSVTGFSATGLVNGETESVLDQVSAGATGTNAGSYTSTASGTDNNYDLTFKDGSLDIAKAKALVTANSGNTTYNGQSQSVDGFSATGLVNGETESVLDQVSAGATGTNAGSYTSTASGTDNNYDLTFIDGSLDIAKAQIKQVSGITADNRIFDTSTNATLNTQSAQFDGIFGTDELTVGSATGQFENSLVGVDKTVNITGISLSGAAAANYDLINTTATTRADIYTLTPTDYLQALPTRQVQALPVASSLTIAAIDVINGGVNLTGLTTLTGVR